MKPKNLISTLQGDRALNILDRNIGKEFKTLKSHEIRVLDAFCKDMISYGCEVGDFDGFFVSYEIPQISRNIFCRSLVSACSSFRKSPCEIMAI